MYSSAFGEGQFLSGARSSQTRYGQRPATQGIDSIQCPASLGKKLVFPMLPAIDFISYVLRSPSGDDQKVMALVALNTLFDVERFQVDLSKVMALGTENRIMTRAFLAWCAIEPKEYSSRSAFLSRHLIGIIYPGESLEDKCTP
jgi:hypothetical protein